MEFKDALKNLLDYSAPKMVEWMDQLDSPEKRFDVLNKFAEYIHPKLARTEHAGDKNNPLLFSMTINAVDAKKRTD
jgi:hypothetical protein